MHPDHVHCTHSCSIGPLCSPGGGLCSSNSIDFLVIVCCAFIDVRGAAMCSKFGVSSPVYKYSRELG